MAVEVQLPRFLRRIDAQRINRSLGNPLPGSDRHGQESGSSGGYDWPDVRYEYDGGDATTPVNQIVATVNPSLELGGRSYAVNLAGLTTHGEVVAAVQAALRTGWPGAVVSFGGVGGGMGMVGFKVVLTMQATVDPPDANWSGTLAHPMHLATTTRNDDDVQDKAGALLAMATAHVRGYLGRSYADASSTVCDWCAVLIGQYLLDQQVAGRADVRDAAGADGSRITYDLRARRNVLIYSGALDHLRLLKPKGAVPC